MRGGAACVAGLFAGCEGLCMLSVHAERGRQGRELYAWHVRDGLACVVHPVTHLTPGAHHHTSSAPNVVVGSMDTTQHAVKCWLVTHVTHTSPEKTVGVCSDKSNP